MRLKCLFLDDGICSFHEVKNFYEKFIGIPADKVSRVLKLVLCF